MNDGSDTLRFGDFSFDPRSRILLRRGTPVPLGGPARSLLAALLDQPGEVVGNRSLMEAAWPGSEKGEANLRVQMTALRKALAPAAPGRDAILNIPGRGYRFAMPLAAAPPPSAPAVAPDEEAGRPPPLLIRLIGREADIAMVGERLRAKAFVTLVGVGGIGKTSLALAVAAEWAGASQRRRLRFFDVSTIAEPALLPKALTSAFEPGSPGLDPLDAISQAAMDEETLLILDNAEHLAQAAGRLAGALLARNPGLRLLVTSREPLEGKGECVCHVAPLAMPGAEVPRSLDEVLAYPAAQLFVERASARLGGFHPRDADAHNLALLCRRLDGLPLAIALAASRIDMFGIAGLAAGMTDLLSAASKTRRTGADRHRTMRAALDGSYHSLASHDRRLLCHLSVFGGPFTPRAAAMVHGEATEEEVVRGLRRLEKKSLLERTALAGGEHGPAFRMLQMTRSYAGEKLIGSGGLAPVSQRHAEHVLQRAQAARDTRAQVNPRLWRMLHAALPDELRTAIDWAFGREGDPALGLRLLTETAVLWLHLNGAPEYRHRLDIALARLEAEGAGDGPDAMRLHTLAGLATLFNDGEVSVITDHFQRAAGIAEGLGAQDATVAPLTALWMTRMLSGERPEAVRLAARLEAKLATAPLGSPQRLALHRVAGLTSYLSGDHRTARRHLDELLAHWQPGSDASSAGLIIDHTAATRSLAARIYWTEGLPDQAAEAARAALRAALGADSSFSVCYALTQAGCPIAIWTGDPAAPDLVQQLMSTAVRYRQPYWSAWAHVFSSVFAVPDAGWPAPLIALPAEVELAPHHLELQGTLHPALADGATIGRAEAGLAAWCAPELLRAKAEGLLRRARGEPGVAQAAERILQESLALAEAGGMRPWMLRSATSLARLWGGQGQARRGRDLLAPILEQFTEGHGTRDLAAARQFLGQ